MAKLDTTNRVVLQDMDVKILNILSQNARTPKSKIARKLGISKDKVYYRIAKMEESGLIKGCTVLLNDSFFGLYSFHVLLQLKPMDSKKFEEISRKFVEYDFVRGAFVYQGRFNFELAVAAINLEEFYHNLEKIIMDCEDMVENYEILILTKKFAGKPFLSTFGDFDFNKKACAKPEKVFKITSNDFELLKALSKNAGKSLIELAKQTGLHIDIVKYSMKKMVKGDVITTFVPIVDYSALGEFVFLILLKVRPLSPEGEKKLERFLWGSPNVMWAAKSVTKYNFILYAHVKTAEQLHNLLSGINQYDKDSVKTCEIMLFSKSLKYTYFPEKLIERTVR
ncbi:MAG: Lrp/AsnC family transcriptional regulator [Candidatus Micrarchaeota archaeon]